jgi:DNA-binding MarR family transcriptional regulator
MSQPGTSSLAKLIFEAEHYVNKQLDAFLKSQDRKITIESWLAMDTLSNDQGKSMKELCDNLHINDSTLTKLIDKMVKNALVYRRPDPKDRRKVLVYLSARGKKLHERLSAGVDACYNDLFIDYSTEDAHMLKTLLSDFVDRSRIK